ncbi:bifunctional hydroxymethylpyrimidine kinase/phosphomethylpyrimidine kinase [Halomonas urumqiensis]|uniref:hydroxymethylpyrimidine kinase n=1 Tax=Halomonas urumqiensis TaxID=1684789 RepID=A0A2N7UK19_9GAMM|nr:hydroxymethylpyrimidine/phosphomethylpyrimidine kinase [Halomonas urumqiensis]PMR80776.1 hydroxymethylpyrimidine/phosphomethylpyrimidine kinase [Halomonas urumqiensis]PTB02734.1 hydroxymethylpyrimidine/phosphomethylpyrimidine kinase [Halomonas urumqiensis]GHE21232.1 hydroxymethylpyrimidine/phosphomethylpyrimidine kinase [Halomonas urumqiensis]
MATSVHRHRQLPVVLVLAGHDPTGGAGLVADAEAIAACGGWALTIPTALTVQDCRNVHAVMPCDPDAMRAMATALATFEVAAIKVGLVPDMATLDAITDIVRRFPGVPLVVDPVLKAGGGCELSTAELVDAFRERLLPLVDILTPNRQELMRLSSVTVDDDTERAVELMTLGCQAVLVTGTDEPARGVAANRVAHTLHAPDLSRQWSWERLDGQYHGSGCTLAASLAARLAAGETLVTACEQAQAFTWQALAHGWQPGDQQALPRRLWQLPEIPPGDSYRVDR